jgi:hypothetical protein
VVKCSARAMGQRFSQAAATLSARMQWLPWQDAAIAAVGTGATARALAHRAGPPVRIVRAAIAWTRELAVIFSLYGLWQLAGGLSLGQATDAVERGRQILHDERWLHFPSEASVQHPFLAHHALLQAFDLYYVVLHVALTGLSLVWVFARHRDRYPVVRNTLAVSTGASLVVALIPVAPPRFISGSGVVDVGRLVGPTVYPATARPGLDQLSAMPSVHVAWALVVAASVIYVLRSPWRWLAVLYPAFTVSVVVITGNHYFADAVVAVAMVAPAGWLSLQLHRRRARRSQAAGAGGEDDDQISLPTDRERPSLSPPDRPAVGTPS